MLPHSNYRARRHARWLAVLTLAGCVFLSGPSTRAETVGVARRALPVAAGGALQPGPDGPTDFNGDGIDDVFWYAPGPSADYLWTGGAGGFRSQSIPVNGTYTPVVGDFDGNGADDIVWYAPGGAPDSLWSGSGSGFSSKAVSIGGTYQPVVGDFDGNGADDILWYAPGPSADHLWSGSSTGFRSRSTPVGGVYEPVVGDFDGNGADDIVWYAPGGAPDSLWSGSGSGFSSRAVSIGGVYEPVVGDFDGNGADDIVWYASGPAADALWSGRGSGFRSSGLTVSGHYEPLVGDVDGDGRADIVWYAAGAAADHLWHSGTGTAFAQRSLTVNGHFTALRRGAVQPPPVETPTAAYAVSAGQVTLRLPMHDTLYVGFHQAASPYAIDQVPGSIPGRWGVLPSRYRSTGARTAADLVVPGGRAVVAPVSGVVVEARGYKLYGHYNDEVVIIAPSTYSGEVHVLHLTGVRVRPGDQVVAGVTEIAGGARRFSFKSQVDDYSGHPSAPHVHVEVSSRPGYRPPSIYG